MATVLSARKTRNVRSAARLPRSIPIVTYLHGRVRSSVRNVVLLRVSCSCGESVVRLWRWPNIAVVTHDPHKTQANRNQKRKEKHGQVAGIGERRRQKRKKKRAIAMNLSCSSVGQPLLLLTSQSDPKLRKIEIYIGTVRYVF